MFEGFSPETIDFLWGIRMNNERDWFLQHKQQYTDTLYKPMKELGQELFQPFLDKPGNILKVSRIYRDARLHHPLPYKESLWICIRRDVDWWAENPCLYFELNPDRAHYGFFWWQPRPNVMEQFRKRIAAQPEPFLSLMAKTRQELGQDVVAECYKRPKEAAPSPELEPYFAWRRQIGCVREEPVNPELFGPELGRRVADCFETLTPVYEYFNQYTV